MPVCPSCGVTNKDDSKFCMSCGTRLAAAPTTAGSPASPATPQPAGRPLPPPDYIGLVGFAIFLVVSAIVLILNPGFFQDLWTGWRPFFAEGRIVRPPETLIMSAIIFFGLNGLAGFVTAYLRLAIRRQRTRALADGLASLGTVAFAVLLVLYLGRLLTGPLVLAILVGIVGVLILAFFVLAVALGLVPELMRREEAQAPARR